MPGRISPSVTREGKAVVSVLAEQIEQTGHALTANELADILRVSRITIFKHAKAGHIPCFRIGTCVRFDPRAVANWLRSQ